MSAGSLSPWGLVPDANVLIDYVEADAGLLGLVAQHLASVHVPSPVLAEVRRLSPREAKRLGIDVVEPTLQQATEAALGGGPTSFQDRLCLVVARDGKWTCLTNDKALRKSCEPVGIPCLWGMEVMRLLVQSGHLPARRAWATAQKMAAGNPYITQPILARFKSQLGL